VSNGTLQVVPGSHKRFGEVRGPLIPWELDNIKSKIIDKYLVPLETKAGDCVILDDSIIHYSAVNKTEGLRLAIQLICVPSDMPSLHYYGRGDVVDVLEVDENFYFEFNPWKIPTAKKVGETKYAYTLIGEEEFKKRLQGKPFDESATSTSFFTKLKNLILN
jgi:hypothetical protein